MTDLRSMLRDEDAERRLLLAVAAAPELLKCAGQVSTEDFFIIENGIRWDRLQSAIKAGKAIYLSEFMPDARLDEVTPIPSFVEHDAELVSNLGACRRSVVLASTIAKSASQRNIEAIKTAIRNFKIYSQVGSTIQPVGHDLERAIKSVVDYDATEKFPVGLPDFDEKTNLERQTLTVVMARPSVGKTALLLQIADKVSERGAKVVFFQKEMSLEHMQRRIAVRRARVSVRALKRNTATPEQRQKCADELMRLYERDTLWFDCSVPQTSDNVLAQVEQHAEHNGTPDLIICDHGALFTDGAENEVKRLDVIYRNMKNMAKRLDTRLIVAAQLNRAVEGQEDKRPDLKDLRASGTIEEHADNVYALYRERYYRPLVEDRTAELIACKERDGERGSRSKMFFAEEYMSFEPLAERTVQR